MGSFLSNLFTYIIDKLEIVVAICALIVAVLAFTGKKLAIGCVIAALVIILFIAGFIHDLTSDNGNGDSTESVTETEVVVQSEGSTQEPNPGIGEGETETEPVIEEGMTETPGIEDNKHIGFKVDEIVIPAGYNIYGVFEYYIDGIFDDIEFSTDDSTVVSANKHYDDHYVQFEANSIGTCKLIAEWKGETAYCNVTVVDPDSYDAGLHKEEVITGFRVEWSGNTLRIVGNITIPDNRIMTHCGVKLYFEDGTEKDIIEYPVENGPQNYIMIAEFDEIDETKFYIEELAVIDGQVVTTDRVWYEK